MYSLRIISLPLYTTHVSGVLTLSNETFFDPFLYIIYIYTLFPHTCKKWTRSVTSHQCSVTVKYKSHHLHSLTAQQPPRRLSVSDGDGDGSLEIELRSARDDDAIVADELDDELTASARQLARLHATFSRARRPKRRERHVRAPGDGILGDAAARPEEARHKVECAALASGRS